MMIETSRQEKFKNILDNIINIQSLGSFTFLKITEADFKKYFLSRTAQKKPPMIPGLPLRPNLALYASILAAFFLLSTSWTLLLGSTYTLFITNFVFGIPALAAVGGVIYKTIQLIQPNFTAPSKWITLLVVLYVAVFFVVGCFYLPLFGQRTFHPPSHPESN